MTNDKIKVKTNEKTYEFVHISKNILDSVLAFNYPAPHQCKRGDCGSCKARVLSGEVEHISRPKLLLSEEEKEQQLFLACSAKPKTDIEIEFLDDITAISAENINENLDVAYKKLQGINAEIIKIIISADFRTIICFLKLREPMNSIPGQYIKLSVEKIKEPRPYSIASLSEDGLEIELHMRYYDKGKIADYMSRNPIGDAVTVEGAYGAAIYSESYYDFDIVAICSGVGFAPLKAIIIEALKRDATKHVHLIYYRRNEQDIYDRKFLKEIAKKYENFVFDEIATRDEKDQNIKIPMEVSLPKILSDIKGKVTYVAGPDNLVNDATKVLTTLPGYDDNLLLTDTFVPLLKETKPAEEEKRKKGFFSRLFS